MKQSEFGEKKEIKLTLIGDLILHHSQIEPAENAGHSSIFSEVYGEFLQSDLLIANLETPLGNKLASKEFSFCAPKKYAIAVKKLHPKLVLLTANNHCLDRGVSGLKKTLDILDKLEIKHTGTRVNGPRGLIVKVRGKKIGIVNYTYGTNMHRNHRALKNDDIAKVNLLQQQARRIPLLHKYKFTDWLCKRYRDTLKKCGFHLSIPADVKYILGYMKRIANMKKKCDYLIACPHIGMQYGEKPCRYTKSTVRRMLLAGADFVCANHEHVIHPFVLYHGKIRGIYALGNFVGTAGVINPPFDKKADTSAAVHIYLNKDNMNTRFSFSLFKSVADENGLCRVVPYYALVSDDPNNQALRETYLSIVSEILGRKEDKILSEYFM